MTADRTVVLTAVAIGAPWVGALMVAAKRQARAIGFTASLVAAAASAMLLYGAPQRESLDEAVMLLFACLTAGATLVIPRRDCRPGVVAGVLWLLGSTLLAYSAQHLGVLLAGWALSTAPFLTERWFGARSWRPRVALAVSTAALAAAIGVVAVGGAPLAIEALRGKSPGGAAALALLIVAVVLRKGVFPAHAWVADAVDGGPVIPTALLLNGHFGALLVAKVIGPLYGAGAGSLVPVLSYLALATALYAAVRALAENAPRRLLAFVALSQSACILAGLESRTAEGITGALAHWVVVTVSTMGLFGVLRLIEVRFGENLSASRHLGLAEHAPRLAVFFAVFGLALVGLPGTLSFCSQDLLIHGTLESHPWTGLLLPIATAMNAVTIFRVFARLFLGKRRTGFTAQADALPRERWALTAAVVFVVLGGLYPQALVISRSAGSTVVATSVGGARVNKRVAH